MAKSAKQRQAEYRERRRVQKLCIEPGCPNKVRKYARCKDHREIAREGQRDRTIMASSYEVLLARVKDLERENLELKREVNRLDRKNFPLLAGEDPYGPYEGMFADELATEGP